MKCFCQQWNVLAPVFERWQVDRDNVQAVVEIAAKLVAIHHVFQFGAGRRNNAHIHLYGLGAADPFELSLLKNAQQLHLQRLTHVANFIEENGSFVRLLEPSDTRLMRSCECAFHVPE